jgi:hypothetical protein
MPSIWTWAEAGTMPGIVMQRDKSGNAFLRASQQQASNIEPIGLRFTDEQRKDNILGH